MLPTKKEKFSLNSKITWRCPSNIAIVKYWGKKGNQLPCNTSISMVLSQSFTETTLELSEKKSKNAVELAYFFEKKKQASFEERIRKYLENQYKHFPFLKECALTVHSFNSFPHSAGIASSASAFGSIALALLDAAKHNSVDEPFLKKASRLARLGSGSASRSMFAGFAVWGKNKWIPESSDQYAVQLNEVHQNFMQMQDAILMIDESEKPVSSSIGHSLMYGHPFAKNRFKQANERSIKLIEVLSSGDYESFIEITEAEALTLHAMMMTSKNHYMLMKPGTVAAIEKIISFRKESSIPICFTLDAGPNVHLLYPKDYKEKVHAFINSNFKKVIFDKIGSGPQKTS